jgi:hypothetical protein
MHPGGAGSMRVELAGASVIIHCFPADDSFVRDLRRAAASASAARAAADSELVGLRDALVAALRAWYPLVALHEREDLASLTRREIVWYLFRDGRVRAQHEASDRLHHALAAARDTAALTDEAMDDAEATLRLADQPRRRPVGGPVG